MKWLRLLLIVLIAVASVCVLMLAYGNKVLLERIEKTRTFEYPTESRP